MKRLTAISCLSAALAATFAECGAAQNLIVNGDFEAAPAFAGWNVLQGPTGGLLLAGHPHSGDNSAGFSATRGFRDSLEQVLSTVPGTEYRISFWFANPWDPPQDNDFSGTWGGTSLFSFVNYPMSPYTEYTFDAQAVATQTALRFTGRDQPAALYLDEVSVVAVPEPSGVLLFVLGTVALLLFSLKFGSRGRLRVTRWEQIS